MSFFAFYADDDRETDNVAKIFSVDRSTYRAAGTGFRYGLEIRTLFESVHFTHSHLSRFLQLADIYSWSPQYLNRHRSSTDTRHQYMLEVFGSAEVNLFPAKYKEWPKA